MIKIKEYVKAESLEQAYELNQKRANRVIGGMLWMRMSSAQVQTAIDLSGLGLNTIEETEGNFAYLSHRNTKTDFPVLAVGIGAMKEELVVSVGARPMEAMRVPIKPEQKALLESDTCTEKDVKLIAGELAARVPTGGNMRASAEYRSHLADVLIKRGLEKIREGKGVREYAD